MSQKQVAALNAFIEAMCGAIDDMPEFAQHLEALEAAGIDLREVRVQARIKVSADEQPAVQTGVQMPLAKACPEATQDEDDAFLRGLHIVPDLAPIDDQPQDDAAHRPTWWQRLRGGR